MGEFEKILLAKVNSGKNLPHAILDLEANYHERGVDASREGLGLAIRHVAGQSHIPMKLVSEQIEMVAKAGDQAAIRCLPDLHCKFFSGS